MAINKYSKTFQTTRKGTNISFQVKRGIKKCTTINNTIIEKSLLVAYDYKLGKNVISDDNL